jgi:Cu/Ag efflux protein CusF
MKKLISIVSAILIAALVVAIPGAAFAAGKTHDMTTEVVSIDAKAKTITLKGDSGNTTAPLLGAAVGEAKNFKAGDKVTVTCQDDEKGAHQGVKAIKKAA